MGVRCGSLKYIYIYLYQGSACDLCVCRGQRTMDWNPPLFPPCGFQGSNLGALGGGKQLFSDPGVMVVIAGYSPYQPDHDTSTSIT